MILRPYQQTAVAEIRRHHVNRLVWPCNWPVGAYRMTPEERAEVERDISLMKAQKENLHLRLEIAIEERDAARAQVETLKEVVASICDVKGVKVVLGVVGECFYMKSDTWDRIVDAARAALKKAGLEP